MAVRGQGCPPPAQHHLHVLSQSPVRGWGPRVILARGDKQAQTIKEPFLVWGCLTLWRPGATQEEEESSEATHEIHSR